MWIYKGNEIKDDDIPKKSIGFLYKITHIPTGKYYFGRKMLTKSKTTQSKGVKKKTEVESDWKSYNSSSKVLQKMINDEGGDKFIKEIILFCETKAQLTLGEEYLLHVTGALFNQKCLNENIRAVIMKKWFTKTPNFFNELKAVSDNLINM